MHIPLSSRLLAVCSHFSMRSGRKMATRAVAELDSSVSSMEQVLQRKKVNRSNSLRSQYCLPSELIQALRLVTEQWSSQELRHSAREMNRKFTMCPVPSEKTTVHSEATRLEQHYTEMFGEDEPDKVRGYVLRDLRNRHRQWQPATANSAFEAAVFAAAFLPRFYATTLYCLRELKRLDDTFVPTSMLEYGGGPAAGLWAVRNTWSERDAVAMYLGVDSRTPLQDLAVHLLNGSSRIPDPRYQFSSALTTGGAFNRSLVVGNHCLISLPSFEDRTKCISSLWHSVARGGYLLLIEKGSNAGFQTILEARQLILAENERSKGAFVSHIVAPCSHEHSCPRFSTSLTPCHFAVPAYCLLDLMARKSEHTGLSNVAHEMVKFSYLLVKKVVGRCDLVKQRTSWPRVVQPVLNRSGLSICRVCSARGNIDELLVTKKSGRELYHMVKNSNWGEQLPVHVSDAPPSNNELRRRTEQQAHLTEEFNNNA